jgi:hypothetical protein
MAEMKISELVKLRGNPDKWRLINIMFDGHVDIFDI